MFLNRHLNTVLLILLVGLALSACTSVNPSSQASIDAESMALSFLPDPERAVLYLYKPRDGSQIATNSSFRINDRHLGEVGLGYFRVLLRPGKHRIISFDSAGDEEDYLAGEKTTFKVSKLTIRVKAGDVIIVRSEFWDGTLKQVSMSEGRSAIRELELYRGDFAVMDSIYQTKEDAAWAACIDTSNTVACGNFIKQYPSSANRANAQQIIQNVEREKKISKTKQSFNRDGALPVEVRRDKYMLALTGHLKNERYPESMVYFDFLERLNTKLDPSFNYFYGEALLKTGKPEEAITKLYSYIKDVGTKGKYYKQALELANQAEQVGQ
jgi:hypothetical protein